jgi:hypothetical protein
MKRIRKKQQKEDVKKFKSHFFNTKEKVIGVCAAGAIILALVIALMFVESSYGKLIVKNNSDINLENVSYVFVNSEDVLTESIETGAISAGTTYKSDLQKANLRYSEANLEVHFTFEGHDELFTDVGYFVDDLNGNINITFSKTDDPNQIKLHIKASNGIFSTKTVDCDEIFTVNLSDGKIYE